MRDGTRAMRFEWLNDSTPAARLQYLRWLAWRVDLEAEFLELYESDELSEPWREIESRIIRCWIGEDYGDGRERMGYLGEVARAS